MRITTTAASPAAVAADLLVVTVPRPPVLTGAAELIDQRLGGRISALVRNGEIRGEEGQTTVLHVDPQAPVRAARVAVVGLGKASRADAERVRNAAGAAARIAASVRARTLAVAVDGMPAAAVEATRCVIDGVALGGYRFDRYRTRPASERPHALTALTVIGGDRSQARRSAVVTRAVNRARDLQNTPSHDLGPEQLAERAREIAGEHAAVTARIYDERFLRRNRMGAFLAVSRAASATRLIVLEHRPPRAREGGLVLGLVGKGITFDTGGLSLKPARSMTGMKFDMSGAAAVLEATAAVAELGLPVRVVTIAGATENLMDASGYRPDDVVTAGNGRTIEITNTDAEGRLVLADCLHHARTLGATHLVDVATLTGAVVVALGDYHAGLMSNDQDWAERLLAAGGRAGEHLWQLPLHDTFRRFLRSDVADMKNSSTAGKGSPSFAGRFLQEFAGEGPWAHVDIAGTADVESTRGDYFGKGGTGFGVRLLVELAESLC